MDKRARIWGTLTSLLTFFSRGFQDIKRLIMIFFSRQEISWHPIFRFPDIFTNKKCRDQTQMRIKMCTVHADWYPTSTLLSDRRCRRLLWCKCSPVMQNIDENVTFFRRAQVRSIGLQLTLSRHMYWTQCKMMWGQLLWPKKNPLKNWNAIGQKWGNSGKSRVQCKGCEIKFPEVSLELKFLEIS